MPGPGGVCSGGGWGVSPPGCLLRGVSAPGGCMLLGVVVFIPACTEADTPPPVDRHTLVKILSWPNFVAVGKNYFRCNIKEPLNKLNSNASKLLIVLVFISLAQPSLSFRIAS